MAGTPGLKTNRPEVKIAVSSASFAKAIAASELTQLEWLDVCANELEADAVVFDATQFPRTDGEYLAQLKKTAVDLGLSVAGIAADAVLGDEGENWLAVADRLGAPLALTHAPPASDDPGAWGAFADALKARAKDAKRRNVTLALRNAPQTLCPSTADLRRIAKDVDSAWLRFGPDIGAAHVSEGATNILGKSVIVTAHLAEPATFARSTDRFAIDLVASLARYRGALLLECTLPAFSEPDADARTALHHALRRFADLRVRALASVSA